MSAHDRRSLDMWMQENKVKSKGTSVTVRNNDVDFAAKALKKKVNREGITKVLRSKEYHETKGQIRRRKKNEAIRRHRKEVAERKIELGY